MHGQNLTVGAERNAKQQKGDISTTKHFAQRGILHSAGM